MPQKKINDLRRLRIVITRERAKIAKGSERKRLKAQLAELRAGKGKKLARRLGRGFVILGKKTGKGLYRYGQYLKEQQEIGEKERRKTKKKGGFQFNPLEGF